MVLLILWIQRREEKRKDVWLFGTDLCHGGHQRSNQNVRQRLSVVRYCRFSYQRLIDCRVRLLSNQRVVLQTEPEWLHMKVFFQEFQITLYG